MIEIILAVFAFLFLLAGFAGSVVPILPGLPFSYMGLLMLQWSGFGGFTQGFLWLWAAITVFVIITDYFLPAFMTRRFGGSRLATIGSIFGLVAGLFFFPPAGLIIGPFFGALAGELIHNRTDSAKAFRVAFGAFLAFIFGTGIKLIITSVMMFYAVKALWN